MKHIGLKRGTVKLLPYDDEWPRLFEAEKQHLLKVLDDITLDIERIGSAPTLIDRLKETSCTWHSSITS